MKKQLTLILVILLFLSIITGSVRAQSPKRLVFDVSHGQNSRIAANWKQAVVDTTRKQLVVSGQNLDEVALDKNDVLVIFYPTTRFTSSEVNPLQHF